MDFNAYGLLAVAAELIIFIFFLIVGGIFIASLFLRLIYRKQEDLENDDFEYSDSQD